MTTKKGNLLTQPTINNRTMMNRQQQGLDSILPSTKKQSEFNIPTLLGGTPSQINLEAFKVNDDPVYLNPEEYFRTVLDHKLLCYKCKKLYTNPIACYKCDKVYCFECLEWELNDHSRCLYCFNIIFKDIAEKVREDIESEYEKNEVKCPYRKCKEIKKLSDIREHIKECLYRDDKSEKFRLDHIDKVVCFSQDVRKSIYYYYMNTISIDFILRMIFMFKITY